MASDLEMQEATDYERIERQLRAEIDTLRGTRDELKAALAIERERAEKAEQYWQTAIAMARLHESQALAAEASLAEARALMKPFAGVLPKTSAHVAIDRFLAPKGGHDHG